MIQPHPIKVICQDCGFKKLFAPGSDAIMPGEYNREYCTKCGSKNIKIKERISIIEKLFVEFLK